MLGSAQAQADDRNLIDNAVKYAGAAEIDVRNDAHGPISINVLDRGPGIPEQSSGRSCNRSIASKRRAIAIQAAQDWDWPSPSSWRSRSTARLRCATAKVAGFRSR